MSTLTEIQEAIVGLREEERKALSVWLESQSPIVLETEDEKKLLKSLDEAMRDLDAGEGMSLKDARNFVRSWARK